MRWAGPRANSWETKTNNPRKGRARRGRGVVSRPLLAGATLFARPRRRRILENPSPTRWEPSDRGFAAEPSSEALESFTRWHLARTGTDPLTFAANLWSLTS